MAPRARKPILDGVKHGTTCYRKGCGCAVGRAAKSLERAAERQRAAERKRAAESVTTGARDPTSTGAKVETDPPAAPSDPRPVGEVEQAVRDELKAHDGAQGTIALAAIAIALAQEIDDRAATSVAGAARQLVATLTELRKASVKVDDELASFLSELGS